MDKGRTCTRDAYKTWLWQNFTTDFTDARSLWIEEEWPINEHFRGKEKLEAPFNYVKKQFKCFWFETAGKLTG